MEVEIEAAPLIITVVFVVFVDVNGEVVVVASVVEVGVTGLTKAGDDGDGSGNGNVSDNCGWAAIAAAIAAEAVMAAAAGDDALAPVPGIRRLPAIIAGSRSLN